MILFIGVEGLRQEFNSGTRKFDFGKDHNEVFVVTRKKATFICKGDPAAFIYFEVPDPSEFIRHALEVKEILSLEAKTAREIETKRKKALEAIDPDQTLRMLRLPKLKVCELSLPGKRKSRSYGMQLATGRRANTSLPGKMVL